MPQASEELRAYWGRLNPTDTDGAAQRALDDAGVEHKNSLISLEKNKEYDPHVRRAVEYLLDEWDWDVKYVEPS